MIGKDFIYLMIMNYVAYSDESYITDHRYRSISVFSIKESSEPEAQDTVYSILETSDVREFKWRKLKNAKYRFCALKILDVIFENMFKWDIRIDSIIWDTQDSRHIIHNRDDTKNFERMFFHLLNNSMKRRPNNSNWRIHPDQNMEIDWATIRDCLAAVGGRCDLVEYPLFGDFFTDQYYKISKFQEINSEKTPCCQIADLFAGITTFSLTNNREFCMWEFCKNTSLFSEPDLQLSNSQTARFPVLDHLYCRCKSLGLYVSLKSKRRLYSYRPTLPLNFWMYTPQIDSDRAPTREAS